MPKERRVGVVALVALSMACVRPVSIDQMYGKYVAEYPFGTDVLELEKDGHYSQVVTIAATGEKIRNVGTWTFDESKQSVDLDRCLSPDDGAGNLESNYKTPFEGKCIFPVEREYLVGSRLRLGPDEGSPHRKVE